MHRHIWDTTNMTFTYLNGRAALTTLAVLGMAAALANGSARANDGGAHIERQPWSFAGVRGRFDREQLKRGFQIYKDVCSNCHGMDRLSFRNLGEKGGPEFPEDGVKGLAETYKISDGPDDKGKMFKRPGRPSDAFPAPFTNEQQARSANNGALPPDFSLIALARGVEAEKPFYMVPWAMLNDIFLSGGYQEGGADYIYALLTGYKDKPPMYKDDKGHLVAMSETTAEGPGIVRCASITEGEAGKPEVCNKMPDTMYYNTAYSGHQIAMPPPPINDGDVKYKDGTPMTRQAYARDIAAFLMWAADPKLEERKRLGLMAVLYLLVTSILLYIAKRRVWGSEPH